LLLAVLLLAAHAPLLRLPYFWDEAGYYIPAARDLLAGSLIPHSTPSNAHPPLVLAWLAFGWRIFGQHVIVTRCAMLFLAAFSLLGFFRLARTVSNATVAAASTLLVAIYPVFFAQSSLAQIDLPAAGLSFWALEAYFRRRRATMVVWFTLAALAKETAILVPIALFFWKLAGVRLCSLLQDSQSRLFRGEQTALQPFVEKRWLLVPIVPLAIWYAYHYLRTGFVFGNAEFFRYNVQATLHPLRMVLALLLRLWQVFGYLGLYVLSIAGFLAMKYPALTGAKDFIEEKHKLKPESVADVAAPRPRIPVQHQVAFLCIALIYLLVLSAIGGAVLARYMLPITPIWILICVSTIWRRLRPWKAVLAIAALAFVGALFVNPPYGFSPEDNLAYRDYIRLHQRAEAYLEARYPHARVLTAWPASDELSHRYLGYVATPLRVVRIEDFTVEQLLSAANSRSQFDVAFIFSTKYQPPHSLFDRWGLWREWKTRYFGYHLDLTPEAAAAVLNGKVVYLDRQAGQWVGVIEMDAIQNAGKQSPQMLLSSSLEAQ
jgi:hypothetical protein